MLQYLTNFAETFEESLYTLETTNTSTADDGLLGLLTGAMLLPLLVVGVLSIIGLWKMFQKAGKPGWAAIVPIYNMWVLAEVAGRPGWWGLLAALLPAIPFVGWIPAVIIIVILSLDVAKRFGRSQVFGIVALFLFSVVGYLILGFGKDRYQAAPTESVTPSSTSDQTTPSTPQV